MTRKNYVPDAGHIIRFHFDAVGGHGQATTRPALVLSPAAYNKRAGLVIVCAMTEERKGNPFEVVPANGSAVVLADQVKSLDWKNAKIDHDGRIDARALAQVKARLRALIFMV